MKRQLPESLWKSETIHIPSTLIEAHRKFLEEKGWSEEYDPKQHGSIGGIDPDDAKTHVVNRFFNSTVRLGYVCLDPKEENALARNMILDQLAEGHIFVLDLAAGNGAGTLGMLSYISSLREENHLPKLPLNLSITAVDYSPEALNFYAELMDKIQPWLERNGICLELELYPCDLSIVGDFGECFESFLDEAKEKQVKRFLCSISAVSGIKAEGMASISDSLKHAAVGLSSRKRNSSWLWVEPYIGKSKFSLQSILDSLKLTFLRKPHKLVQKREAIELFADIDFELEPLEPRRFDWFDPYLNDTAKGGVSVAVFKND